MAQHFKTSYPWVQFPVITNGPMAGVAGPELVTAITKAGGLGFMATGKDIAIAEKNLKTVQKLLGHELPIGLGVLCFAIKLDDFVRLVKEYQPVAVWLFAAQDYHDYATWARAVRNVSKAKIWIQTNSVKEAIAADFADVLVMQGADAGGHGAEKAAGVISLVPETVDALPDKPIIAAGGIADGRGIAAAVALGAIGVTMGTRFLASKEAEMTEPYQKAVLAASDGGQSTFKHKVFDEMAAGGNIWPVSYDGRGLRNATSRDYDRGVGVEENRKLFAEAAEKHGGFASTMEETRANAWAGTGVGLVRSVESAGDIVRGGREEALRILDGYKRRFE